MEGNSTMGPRRRHQASNAKLLYHIWLVAGASEPKSLRVERVSSENEGRPLLRLNHVAPVKSCDGKLDYFACKRYGGSNCRRIINLLLTGSTGFSMFHVHHQRVGAALRMSYAGFNGYHRQA